MMVSREHASSIASWLVTGAILFFLIRFAWANWHEIQDLEINLHLGALVFSICILAVYLLGRALLWHYLTIRYEVAIPVQEAISAWFLSQLGKYVPGKVFMYFTRLYYYARAGRGKTLFSLSFLLETIATFLSSILIVLIALAFLDLPRIQPYRPALILAFLILIIVSHPKVLRGLSSRALRLLGRPPVAITPSTRDTAVFVGLYTLNWLVFGMAFFVFINAIYRVSFDYILYLAAAFSAASLIGMLSVIVPSGLGVREGVLILMLTPVMPVGAAIVVSFAARLWFTSTELAGIGVFWLLTRKAVRHGSEVDFFADVS